MVVEAVYQAGPMLVLVPPGVLVVLVVVERLGEVLTPVALETHHRFRQAKEITVEVETQSTTTLQVVVVVLAVAVVLQTKTVAQAAAVQQTR